MYKYIFVIIVRYIVFVWNELFEIWLFVLFEKKRVVLIKVLREKYVYLIFFVFVVLFMKKKIFYNM